MHHADTFVIRSLKGKPRSRNSDRGGILSQKYLLRGIKTPRTVLFQKRFLAAAQESLALAAAHRIEIPPLRGDFQYLAAAHFLLKSVFGGNQAGGYGERRSDLVQGLPLFHTVKSAVL